MEKSLAAEAAIAQIKEVVRQYTAPAGIPKYEALRQIIDIVEDYVAPAQSAEVFAEEITAAMIAAGAAAARINVERTGGNDPVVIYRAMRTEAIKAALGAPACSSGE
ncbi:hypothetical protein [Pigmentiphaga kullae]|uniref:Uncharacterized protein n=1 Tax=Pigmentiphaga kullae TaxID=151784 RepID=A0A4Q7NM53_9BURK|nr:hypothetical protein [Pigmentiphaga kullae]RZS86038.1 hypothetical protein EV675_2072 [Pigmentiphaga kullae]